MKALTALIIFTLLGTRNARATDSLVVKLSVYDCATCTHTLPGILRAHKDVLVVMDAEFQDDSTAIYEKYGLPASLLCIVWSTERYASLSKTLESEIIQTCGGKEVQRILLKEASGFSKLQCATPHFVQCARKVPSSLKFKDYPGYTIIDNYVTDEKFLFLKASDSLQKLTVTDSAMQALYAQQFGSADAYSEYRAAYTRNSKLKPKITAVAAKNDSTVVFCLLTYYRSEVVGEDTAFDKLLSIITYARGRVQSIAAVDDRDIQGKYGLNEYQMFYHGGSVYLGVIASPGNNAAEPNMLAKLDLRRGTYTAKTLPNILLSAYNLQYKLGYNYTTPHQSHQFVGFPLDDKIFDLQTGKSLLIPLDTQVFESNRDLMTSRNPGYILNDLKYNPATGLITLLYQIGDKKYISTLKPGAKKFITTIALFELSYYQTFIKNAAVSADGKRLLFVRKGKGCFEYCDYAGCANTIANGD